MLRPLMPPNWSRSSRPGWNQRRELRLWDRPGVDHLPNRFRAISPQPDAGMASEPFRRSPIEPRSWPGHDMTTTARLVTMSNQS